MKLAEVSPLPIIIYNVPGRTASNVTAETVLRLANSSSKFIAVKEASGDMNQVQKILKYRPEGFLVLSGDDTITLPIIGCGGDGVISVIANALPHQYSSMVKNALDGDYWMHSASISCCRTFTPGYMSMEIRRESKLHWPLWGVARMSCDYRMCPSAAILLTTLSRSCRRLVCADFQELMSE